MKLRGVPQKGFVYLATKRGFDVGFCALALFLLSPLLLLIAVWIKLDSKGTILFRQKRRGKDGSEFEMLKFRTMIESAERATGPIWASDRDDRETTSGRILRKLHLDELPQLMNILKGEMSLVGPRPERTFFYPQLEKQIPGFSNRCLVMPGLTGLAQIRQDHDSSLTAVQRKYIYDMEYIQQCSFWLDLVIICKTAKLVARRFKEVLQ